MNRGWFEDQLRYHYWANRRLLPAMERLTPEQYNQDLGSSFPSIRATLAHLLNAETVWLGRMMGEALPPVTPADLPTAAAAGQRWADLEATYMGLLGMLGETLQERTMMVRTSKGQEFLHSYGEALQHLVNHGTYHRGQIAAMLRQLGEAPPSTDLILYYRECNA